MKYAEKIGALKMDFLGLRNLDVIQKAMEIIKHTEGVDLHPYRIDTEDADTYEMLARGEAIGVFQFESDGMRGALRLVKPTVLNDLISLVALYRPGPMAHISSYAARKAGVEDVSYPDPRAEKILKETYGIVVFQEQSMLVARELAGFTPGEADDLRKAISKKLRHLMDLLKPKFIKGCIENGVAKEVAETVWKDNEAAAEYSFNKCARGKNTFVRLPDGSKMSLSTAYKEQPTEIMSMWEDGTIRPHKVAKIVKTGNKKLLKIKTSRRMIDVTPEHRLLTTEGYVEAGKLKPGMELITEPWPLTERQIAARKKTMKKLAQQPERKELDKRTSERMKKYQAARSYEDQRDHMLSMHAKYPDLTRNAVVAMHEKVKWLWANDSQWRKETMQKSLANVRDAYNTGPGYGHCSVASNGMWCASKPERAMCEWLIELGIDFEMHKVLQNGRVCDFYFEGIYWEMDGMDRTADYFAEKYGKGLPYVVVTPEDYKPIVTQHLHLEHGQNGDPILSITQAADGMTYDIEMAPNGPLNYIANGIVSHNSHAACYAYLAYVTAYLKCHYPEAYMAALLSSVMGVKDKVPFYLQESRRMGLRVLPPDINRSFKEFSIHEVTDEDKTEEYMHKYEILFGLTAIKRVGENVVQELRQEREENGPFRSIYDLIRRMPHFNKTTFEQLIRGGALDVTGDSRRSMLAVVEPTLDAMRKEVKEKETIFLKEARDRFAAAENPNGAQEYDLFGDLAGASKNGNKKWEPLEKKVVEAIAKIANAKRHVPDEKVARQVAMDALEKSFMLKAKKELKDQGVTGEDLDQQAGSNANKMMKKEGKPVIDHWLPIVLPALKIYLDKLSENEQFELAMAESIDNELSKEDWTWAERLNHEFDALGVYASGHPLDECKKEWARYVTLGLGDITSEYENKKVTVCGVVTGVRLIQMKNGKQMAAITLDDLSGSKEVTFFSDAIEDGTLDMLGKGETVVIRAVVKEDLFQASRDEDTDDSADAEDAEKPVKLIAQSAHPWHPEQIGDGPVEIHLGEELMDKPAELKRKLTQLNAILKRHQGTETAHIIAPNGKVSVSPHKIDINHILMRELRLVMRSRKAVR